MLAQLRCFVDGNYVIFLTLIPQKIAIGGAVPKEDPAATRKQQAFLSLVVRNKASVLGKKGLKVVLLTSPSVRRRSKHRTPAYRRQMATSLRRKAHDLPPPRAPPYAVYLAREEKNSA